MYDLPRGTHRLLYEGWQRSCQCNGRCVRGSAYLQRYILRRGDSAVMSVVSEHLQKMNGEFIDRLFSCREPRSLFHAIEDLSVIVIWQSRSRILLVSKNCRTYKRMEQILDAKKGRNVQ